MKTQKTNRNYVLVTGATTGIGYEIARQYALRSRSLILIGRNKRLLRKIKKNFETDHNVDVILFIIDLTKNDNVDYLYKQCKKMKLVVDILVNNAGVGFYGDFIDLKFNKISEIINLNLIAFTRIIYLFSRDMKKRNYGEILNVASVAGFLPGPKMAVYHATKAFVVSLTLALSVEFKKLNIKISALCPGYTATHFQKNANLSGTRLANFLLMSSQNVACTAVKEFQKGKIIIVTGIWNKFFVGFYRFLPQTWVPELVNLYWNQIK